MAVKFTSGLGFVKRQIREAADEKKQSVVDLLLGKTDDALAGPRSGRTYRIPGTDVTYTASAPGEYPAFRTGHLRASMRGKVLDNAAVVGTNWNLAAAVQEARPFMGQVLEESEDEIGAILKSPWVGLDRA